MKKTLGLVLLMTSLIGSEVPQIDIGVGPGYQHDQFKSTIVARIPGLPPFALYKENYDPMQSVLAEGFANFSAKSIQVQMMGTFGWLVSGKMKAVPSIISGPGLFISPEFHAKPRGTLASAYGNVGYQIDLWTNEKQRVSLVPLAGYGYDQQWIHRRHVSPSPQIIPLTNAPGQDHAEAFLNVSEKVSRAWHGPFLGMTFFAQPAQKFSFSLMYSFHWLSFFEKSSFSVPSFGFSGSTQLTDELTQVTDIRNVTVDAHGHKGWLRARYEATEHWKIDLFATYLHYFTINGRSSFHFFVFSQTPGFVIDGNLGRGLYKGRWSSFSIVLNPSYAF